MGLMHSSLTASRFRIAKANLKEDWKEIYRDRLNEFSFSEPPQGIGKEKIQGWCQIGNLINTDFEDFNQWLFEGWILFALRTDKKKIPGKRFKVVLKQNCEQWCEEHGVTRCPSTVKQELKDQLEIEWLSRIIPSTNHVEIAWNINDNIVYVGTHSDTTCDEIRKRFFRTFARKLIPHSPIDWIENSTLMEQIIITSPTQFGEAQ